MKLRVIKQSIRSLSLQQIVKLDDWIHGLIENAGNTGGQRVTKAEHRSGNKTYRSEMVRCGKKSCKCAEGKLHGPYWYAYWSEGGKTRSQYIGKRLPKGIKPPRDTKSRNVR